MNIAQAKEILGEVFGFMAEDANDVVRYLKLLSNAKILDVGTGRGYFAIILALNGYRVVTGEPEHDNSIYAKKDWLGNFKKVSADDLVRFKAFDSHDMPFDDNFFDAIFFFGVLHHIDEKKRSKVLQESVRIAKRNGVICFIEPNKNGLAVIRERDPSHPETADPTGYTQGLALLLGKNEGVSFDSFIFRKERI